MDNFEKINSVDSSRKKIVWIVWFALVNSLFVYLIVGYFVRQSNQAMVNNDILPVLTPILAAISFVISVLIFLLSPKLAKKRNFFTYCIFRWAFAESICIYGLVLFILGATWYIFGSFFILSLFLFMILMPTQATLDRFNYLKNPTHSPPM